MKHASTLFKTLGFAIAIIFLLAVSNDSPAACTTDSECLLLCEPVDLDCDGGPGSAK